MGRTLRRLPGTDKIFIPGATIRHLIKLVTDPKHESTTQLNRRKAIFIMIGTNNLGNGNTPLFIERQTEILLRQIRAKTQATILLTSILPRPRDGPIPTKALIDTNRSLKILTERIPGTKYFRTDKAYVYKGRIQLDLFQKYGRAGHPDLLHMTWKGSSKLSNMIRQRSIHEMGRQQTGTRKMTSTKLNKSQI